MAAGADGIHLGQEDLPLELARRLLGPEALVGLSITDATQLNAPDASEADYLGVGAVFPTGSKGDATLAGLHLIGAARKATTAPIVAIGGITTENAGLVIAAGADSLAAISAITQAPDPAAAVQALAAAVKEARR